MNPAINDRKPKLLRSVLNIFLSNRVLLILVLLSFGMCVNVSACDAYCSDCTSCTNAINSASSGQTICLNANIINFSGTCINNPANFNNKIFNCQGHTMEGDDEGVDFGIYLRGMTGNTIRNCVVSDFWRGIYLYSSSNNTIMNNVVNSNHFGIFLEYSLNNNIINNTANSNEHGMWIFSSSNSNNLINNAANSNNYYGINVLHSLNNTLINNTANSNNFYGILLGHSQNSRLMNSIANSNKYYGINLLYSLNNNITSSTANSNNHSGINLLYSSNNTLANNIENNNSYGIYLYSSSNNTINQNEMYSNAEYDIYLLTGSENLGYDNACDNTYGWDDQGKTGCAYNSVTTTCSNGRSTNLNSATIYPTTNWQTLSDSLNGFSDTKRYKVSVSSQGEYEFSLCSSDGGGTNYDTYLCLFESDGSPVTSNDDSCGTASKINQELSPGTYYVQVSGYMYNYGTYTLAFRG